LLKGEKTLAKTKKDRLNEKFYKYVRKNPFIRSPITLLYVLAILAIVIAYVIYLTKESM
jgi:hypothetical protein